MVRVAAEVACGRVVVTALYPACVSHSRRTRYHARRDADHPPLLASWAIRFYERHGFRLVDSPEKDRLLRRYWDIPERQVETSVVRAVDRPGPDR